VQPVPRWIPVVTVSTLFLLGYTLLYLVQQGDRFL
jgi:hypothetical protein